MKRTNPTALIALICLTFAFLALSCGSSPRKDPAASRKISVLHAGSLAVPMKSLAAAFESENPGVKIQLEAAGSLACVRKITELNQQCDLLALADYGLIDELMIPDHANWNILFATNELCLAYTGKSGRSGEINAGNWTEILTDPEIRYGRSDPDADPCGYRTVMALQLDSLCQPAGKEVNKLLQKDTRFIRGKETDLNALLETGTIDYMFNYRSVAMQHGFKFLKLPDSVNLGNPELNDWYSNARVEVRGASPGARVMLTGAPIVYGMTIPLNAPNPDLALRFVRFITDPEKGGAIIGQSGQTFLRPRYSNGSKTQQRK